MTIVLTNDGQSIRFLPDYCPRCNPIGYCADSRLRMASLTDPTRVTWHGGKSVICEYHCVGCGDNWRRADLWTAQEAGFDPKSEGAA